MPSAYDGRLLSATVFAATCSSCWRQTAAVASTDAPNRRFSTPARKRPSPPPHHRSHIRCALSRAGNRHEQGSWQGVLPGNVVRSGTVAYHQIHRSGQLEYLGQDHRSVFRVSDLARKKHDLPALAAAVILRGEIVATGAVGVRQVDERDRRYRGILAYWLGRGCRWDRGAGVGRLFFTLSRAL